MYNKIKAFINAPHIDGSKGMFEMLDLREESIKLGWGEHDNYGTDGDRALIFHEHLYKDLASQSLFFSLIVTGIAAVVLFIGKILTENNRRASMQFK